MKILKGSQNGMPLSQQGSWEQPQKREGKMKHLLSASLKPILPEFCSP